MSRCRFVSAMKAESFPVETACEVTGVSTSAYYGWLAKVAAGPTEQMVLHQVEHRQIETPVVE